MIGRPPLVHLETGKECGDWLLLRRLDPPHVKRTHWRCECACGTVRDVAAYALTTGRSRSCGKHPIGVIARRPMRTPAIASIFQAGAL